MIKNNLQTFEGIILTEPELVYVLDRTVNIIGVLCTLKDLFENVRIEDTKILMYEFFAKINDKIFIVRIKGDLDYYYKNIKKGNKVKITGKNRKTVQSYFLITEGGKGDVFLTPMIEANNIELLNYDGKGVI